MLWYKFELYLHTLSYVSNTGVIWWTVFFSFLTLGWFYSCTWSWECQLKTVCVLWLESLEMSTVQSRDAQLQAFMQMYELRAACNDCTHKQSRICYSIITTPHRCSHNLLLVRAKARGHKWSPVSMRPSYPCPNRYEVCWYFKEDVGCYVHHDRCTFASSPEEAAVWNLQKHTNLDHERLIHLITQRQRLDKQSRQEDGQSRAHEPLSYKEKLLEEYRRSCNEILIVSIMHKKLHNATVHNHGTSMF